MKKLNMADLAQTFQALTDETRLELMMTLQAGEQNVTALCKLLRIRQPRVSHHLGLLRLHGLVTDQRRGKEVFYTVDAAGLAKVKKALRPFLR